MRASLSLLLLLVACGGANAQPSLTLLASTTRPYVDQQVRVTLRIELPDGFALNDPALELQIPWLLSEFGFQWSELPEEWLRARHQATSGLPLRLAPDLAGIVADEVRSDDGKKTRRFELQWRLTVNEPDELTRGGIVFAPVRLKHSRGAVASNGVTLQVRGVPLPPPDLPRLYLGVGDWQMDAAVSPAPFGLGDTARVTLRVHGTGELSRVRQPLPSQLWPGDRVRIESGAETMENDSRRFYFTLHPRTVGPLTLPPLAYACFDPAREVYQRRELAAVTISRAASPSRTSASQRPYPNKIPERLEVVGLDWCALDYKPSAFPWLEVIGFLLLPAIPWLALWSLRYHLWPHAWPLRARPSRRAAHLALHALENRRRPLDAVRIHEVLLRYLQSRLGWQTSEPTATETAAALRSANLDAVLTRETCELIDLLNEARFGEPSASVANLVGRARHVITRLEAAP